MSFLKRKVAIAGAILSVVMSAAILGNSLIYAFNEDYKSWKQYGSSWSTMYLGSSSDTVKQSGCAVTAAAILMVHSGSVTSDDFSPAVIIDFLNQHNGFNAYGILNWNVLSDYAPDFQFVSDKNQVLTGRTQAEKAQEIKDYLDEGYYVMVRISNARTTHFVAIDSVKGERVTMMDPGSSSTSLFDKYSAEDVTQVRLFRGKNSGIAPEPAVPEPEMPVQETEQTEAREELVIQPEDFVLIPSTAPPPVPETAAPETTAVSVPVTAASTAPVVTSESVVTTVTTPVTTRLQTTMPEIVITTKATTYASTETISNILQITVPETQATECIIDPAADEHLLENILSPDTAATDKSAEENHTIEFVVLADAPETAPSGEIQNTKIISVPEDQAEAALIELKEQQIFMSVRFTVQADLNLRKAANTEAEILSVIPAYTSLNVVEVDEAFKWGKVAFNGNEGWIYLDFAQL